MNIKKLNLKLIMTYAVVIYLVVQLVLIYIFWGANQGSDMGAYLKMAKACYESGTWYPSVKHIYDSYIWNPGLINLLILQWHVFGTDNANMLVNLLMNLGIIYEVYWLANYFFSQKVAYISVIFFVLLYSNLWIVLLACSDIPFLFMALSGYCLTLSALDLEPTKKKAILFICSGICFALSNYVRPLVFIFLLAVLVYMFIKKTRWFNYVLLLVPYALINFSIALISHHNMGYYIYQSTTTGVNLIMTCNDKAYGGVANELFQDSTSTCFLDKPDELTFEEKDKIWKERSIEWVKDNPLQFTKLYVMKLFGLWVEDSWPDRPMIGGFGFANEASKGDNYVWLAKRAGGMLLKGWSYYLLLLLFVFTVWKHKKEILSPKGNLILILFLGVLATCIFPVCPRYHYPFLFILIIWSAYGFEQKFIEQKQK